MTNVKTTGKKSSNTLVRDLVNVGIFGLAMLMMGQGILMLGICLVVDLLTGACLKFSNFCF